MSVDLDRKQRIRLDLAISRGDQRLVQQLVKGCRNLNRLNNRGRTALHEAIHAQFLRIAEILLENGASLDKQDRSGNTPLHLAIKMDTEQLVEVLLKRGASLEIKNHQNHTPLLSATVKTCFNLAVIRLLIRQGASLKVFDKLYYTPMLHLEYSFGKVEAIEDLFKMDCGFSQKLLELRLLGHRFGISGDLYQGLPLPLLLPLMIKSFKKFFCLSEKNAFYNQVLEAFQLVLEDPFSTTKMLERMRAGKLAIFFPGWKSHVVTVVVLGNKLIKGNRGDSINYLAGLQFFKINNPLNLDLALSTAVKNNFQTKRKRLSILYFEEKLDVLLGLKWRFTIPLNWQSSGNCGWVALKLALRSASILLKDNNYKAFVAFDRAHALTKLNLFEQEDSLQALCDFNDLRAKLTPKCQKRCWRLPLALS